MDRLRSSDLNHFINAPIITLMRTLEVLVKSVHRIAQKNLLTTCSLYSQAYATHIGKPFNLQNPYNSEWIQVRYPGVIYTKTVI